MPSSQIKIEENQRGS